CTCQSCFFFFSSRRRHTRWPRDWSSDVCSSDLNGRGGDGGEVRIALAPEIDHPHAKLIRTSPPSPPRPLISLPLLLMLAAVALGWNLNGYRLFDPDEGRNAEVAREMAQSNDYVVPHLDGLPYLDKPIVYFAAAA